MSTPAYTCPYCRLPSDGTSTSCPNCGAPTDVRARVSDSGWVEQPAIKDMARIRFSRSTCQISGTYVPVAEFKLDPADQVYFSHHVLLHADPGVQLNMMKMPGGWNRKLAGMPLIMMTANGPGHVALSADRPGDTYAVPLPANHAIDVIEHRFLTATHNVGYHWERAGIYYETGTGDDQEYHYPLGRTMDRFFAQGGPGLLLLHAPGNTFIRDLRQGERILIEPGALVWKDRTVGMSLHFEYPHGQYWFTSRRYQGKAIWLVLRGPGRVAIQSVFERPETVGYITGSSGATTHYW